MQKSDFVRIQHTLDAAHKIREFIQGKNRVDLESDDLLSFAVVRALEIVGEAVKQISDDVKKAHPQIEWAEIGAARNRLIHGYFDVDLDIVWAIVTKDIPRLISKLERIVETDESQ